MDVFVKSFSSWRTIKHAKSLSFGLVLDSLDKETSSLTVVGNTINHNDVGNWLVADGGIYLISQVKPNEGTCVLSLLPPLEAFARMIPFAEPAAGQTIGGFVAAEIQQHWKACEDPVYALPYLSVSDSDTVPFVMPDLDNAGMFSLSDYCRLMRRTYGVTISFRDAGTFLACEIRTSSAGSRQVSFSDGRSQLKSFDCAESGVAKITAIQDGVTYDWYLSEDGVISQGIPARRARGSWVTISVSSGTDIELKVAETFAKERSGHKVEFISELDLNVSDNCKFVIYGDILQSYISCKRKNSTDDRFVYKAGELATTASEKMRGLIK